MIYAVQPGKETRVQTEAVFAPGAAGTTGKRAQDPAAEMGEDRLVIFVRPRRPPLRVRARPGASVTATIAGRPCGISLWERTKGGAIIAIEHPSRSQPEPDLIVATTIEDAVQTLEQMAASGIEAHDLPMPPTNVDGLVSALGQAVRHRAMGRAFSALVSEFLSRLGPVGEVRLPKSGENGE